ncbi:MAG: MogA/MoaB family molybdenum cofactor biosynthesis protein [Polyangiaceae bacterium]|nr:MogA/MoaB family molybdenum cofactor biosynthesis protein [Polyangiaceae bacterium]
MKERAIRVATVTLSDTRTLADDEGGRLLGELLTGAGFEVAVHAVVREEVEAMRAHVRALSADTAVDAIVLTGGTGITPRDQTVEAIAPLFEKTLDGFGEAFRRLSWDQIGPNAMLSRAIAGTVNQKVVFALPGSPKAVRLAVEKLIAPVLDHAVALATGKAGQHHAKGHGDHGVHNHHDVHAANGVHHHVPKRDVGIGGGER